GKRQAADNVESSPPTGKPSPGSCPVARRRDRRRASTLWVNSSMPSTQFHTSPNLLAFCFKNSRPRVASSLGGPGPLVVPPRRRSHLKRAERKLVKPLI